MRAHPSFLRSKCGRSTIEGTSLPIRLHPSSERRSHARSRPLQETLLAEDDGGPGQPSRNAKPRDADEFTLCLSKLDATATRPHASPRRRVNAGVSTRSKSSEDWSPRKRQFSTTRPSVRRPNVPPDPARDPHPRSRRPSSRIQPDGAPEHGHKDRPRRRSVPRLFKNLSHVAPSTGRGARAPRHAGSRTGATRFGDGSRSEVRELQTSTSFRIPRCEGHQANGA